MAKEDLRIKKTYNSLIIAMSKILKSQNFNQITVIDLCEKAIISRATFYSHFNHKYDFLKYWLMNLKEEYIYENKSYHELEKMVNDCIEKNKTIIKNIINDADIETLNILIEFLTSIVKLNIVKKIDENTNFKHVVFSNFYVGGILWYLIWQVKNNFPSDILTMNGYLYDIIKKLEEYR